MPEYIRTESVIITLRVTADDPEAADDIGNDFFDSLLFDDKTLRKRAAQINTPECYYVGADSNGDSTISTCTKSSSN